MATFDEAIRFARRMAARTGRHQRVYGLRDWDNTDDESIHNDVRCAICDERIITNRYGHYQEEVGEFIGKYGDGVLAHAQCGIDRGLEVA